MKKISLFLLVTMMIIAYPLNIFADNILSKDALEEIFETDEIEDYAFYFTDGNTEIFQNNQDVFAGGEVAQVFSSIIILQMVDEGLITLDDKIADYTFDDRFGDITIEDILTNKSGIENQIYQTGADFETNYRPSYDYKQLIPENTGTIYSSTAHSLVEYVIENTYGMAYEDVVYRALFEPLGMENTDFDEDRLDYINDYYSLLHTSADVVTTHDDMAIFIKSLMDSDYDLSLLGFKVVDYNGSEIAFLNGDFVNDYTTIVLLPDSNVAGYYTYNGFSPLLQSSLINDLSINLYGKEVPAYEGKGGIQSDYSSYEGTYMGTSFAYSTLEYVLNVFNQTKVSVDNGINVGVVTYNYEEDGVLYSDDVNTPITFDNIDGTNYMYIGDSTYVDIPFYKTNIFIFALIFLPLIYFIIEIFISKDKYVKMINAILSIGIIGIILNIVMMIFDTNRIIFNVPTVFILFNFATAIFLLIKIFYFIFNIKKFQEATVTLKVANIFTLVGSVGVMYSLIALKLFL